MKITDAVKTFLYTLVQWTWGFVQSFAGLCLLIKYRKCRHRFYHGAVLTYHDGSFGGISLGMFIFVNANRGEKWIKDTEVHEYGHTVQSLVLGPLYMFVIGLPSMVWCNGKKYVALRNGKGVSYYAFYPEKYANILGSRVTKENPPTYESGIPKAYFQKLEAEKSNDE